jgi:type IV pilus assembly protein PilB
VKVLIAEDDAVSRTVLRKSVEKLGHACVVARDGLEAWRAYQDTPDVEVVISDWMMPGIEGPEFCRRVRGLEREGYTFFVFLTALGGREHLLEGMESGADEYLTKPLDGDRLRAVLGSAARVTSLHQHLRAGKEEEKGSGRGDRRAGLPDRRRSRPGGGKVWDVLLSQGRISEEQLQLALESQKENGKDLGATLVSLGYISEEDLARAQAQRLRLDYRDLDEVAVDPAALALVPEKVLRRYGALPLALGDGEITMAMSDPTDIHALEDLRFISGRRVTPVVVAGGDLRRAHNRLFSGGEGVAEILEEAAEDGAENTGEVELGAEAGGDDAPVVRLVDSVLKSAVGEGASDVHVEPHAQGLDVRLRVDGVLRNVMFIPAGLRNGVIARLKVLANLDIAERRVPQDGRFSVRVGETKVDLRVAVLPTVYGEGVVIRLLDTSNLQTDLAGLGFARRDY